MIAKIEKWIITLSILLLVILALYACLQGV